MVAGLHLAPTASGHSPDHVIVQDNGGGYVDDFLSLREEWRAAGTKVEFRGACKSACTLFLDLPDVCAHPGAEFWFHAPFHRPIDGITVYDDGGTQDLLGEYPLAIRSMIEANGGLTEDWLVLRNQHMSELIPECQ